MSEESNIPELDMGEESAAARRRWIRQQLLRHKPIIMGGVDCVCCFNCNDFRSDLERFTGNEIPWWTNSEDLDRAVQALNGTFPQFASIINEEDVGYPQFSYRGRCIHVREKVLIVQGKISPRISTNIDYELTIKFRLGWITVDFDKNSSRRLFDAVVDASEYLPSRGKSGRSLFGMSPVEIVSQVLNWIIDVEKLIAKTISISDFESKYGPGRDFPKPEIPRNPSGGAFL